MATGVRVAITLACTECKRRNYQTKKSKRNTPDRVEFEEVLPLVRAATRCTGRPARMARQTRHQRRAAPRAGCRHAGRAGARPRSAGARSGRPQPAEDARPAARARARAAASAASLHPRVAGRSSRRSSGRTSSS